MMDTTIVVQQCSKYDYCHVLVINLYVQGFHESFSHPLWDSFSPMFTVYTFVLTLAIKKM